MQNKDFMTYFLTIQNCVMNGTSIKNWSMIPAYTEVEISCA